MQLVHLPTVYYSANYLDEKGLPNCHVLFFTSFIVIGDGF